MEKTNKTLLSTQEDTIKFASIIAKYLKAGDILALTGDLGAGKTFICREIIRHFCGNNIEVQSPTFNILKTYQTPDFIIYHFDLYRLKSIDEIYELGLDEAFNHLCLIEWPEIIMHILPNPVVRLDIQMLDDETRLVTLPQKLFDAPTS